MADKCLADLPPRTKDWDGGSFPSSSGGRWSVLALCGTALDAHVSFPAFPASWLAPGGAGAAVPGHCCAIGGRNSPTERWEDVAPRWGGVSADTASSCCLPDLAGVGAAVLGHCPKCGVEIHRSAEHWIVVAMALPSLSLAWSLVQRYCRITSETVMDFEMQLLGLLLWDLNQATSAETREKWKRSWACTFSNSKESQCTIPPRIWGKTHELGIRAVTTLSKLA